MIALMHVEKQSLEAVFPEQCLKATPDPEFLSNLYDFDMSLCPHRPSKARTSHITQIFTETFDAINSSSRVPELLVWMQSQVCLTISVMLSRLSCYTHRNTLIGGMTSLGIIGDLLMSGFTKNYLRLKFLTIPFVKSFCIFLYPQHWWISHNFLTYTISYRRFWI